MRHTPENRKEPAALVRMILAQAAAPAMMIIATVVFLSTGFGMEAWDDVILRAVYSAVMLGFLVWIAGTACLKPKKGAAGQALKMCRALLIPALLLCAADILLHVMNGARLTLTASVVPAVLTFLLVGVFEELTYRAVIFEGINGFLNRNRDRKTYTAAAVISFILFGLTHVLSALLSAETYADRKLLAQALLKAVSSGVFALIMMLVYLRTADVWACALTHAVYDMIVGMPSRLLQGKITMEYVRTDNAYGIIAAYIAMIVIQLIIYLALRGKYLPKLTEQAPAEEAEG